MTNTAELVLVAFLACWLALPVLWAWRFVLTYRRQVAAPPAQPAYLPRACVILSLRGADPSLGACLRGLLRQDYPDYEVRFIIDSDADPAWEVVRSVLAEGLPPGARARAEALRERQPTCSLKVSSILQVLDSLGADVEVLAFLDADVVPPPNWLRNLTAPLRDPSVGATTGYRWFAPPERNWGTLVRYLWNAAALTQMKVFRIAWGGSLAVHARVFRCPRTREHWLCSFSEDAGMFGLVRGLGQRLVHVPKVTAVNPESINLKSCCTFIRRQLFVARFQHVWWTSLWLMNLGIGLALLATVGLLIVAVWQQHWVAAAGLTGLLVCYGGGLAGALALAELSIHSLFPHPERKVPLRLLSWRLLPALVLTQVVHIGCLLSALSLRRISWRGITYAIDGPQRLRLLGYQPYVPPTRSEQAGQSIL